MAEIKEIEYEVLGSGPIYIHMNEEDPLAKNDTIRFSDLIDRTFIHLPNDFFSDINKSININGMQLSTFPKVLIMRNYHAMLSIAKHTSSFFNRPQMASRRIKTFSYEKPFVKGQ